MLSVHVYRSTCICHPNMNFQEGERFWYVKPQTLAFNILKKCYVLIFTFLCVFVTPVGIFKRENSTLKGEIRNVLTDWLP